MTSHLTVSQLYQVEPTAMLPSLDLNYDRGTVLSVHFAVVTAPRFEKYGLICSTGAVVSPKILLITVPASADRIANDRKRSELLGYRFRCCVFD